MTGRIPRAAVVLIAIAALSQPHLYAQSTQQSEVEIVIFTPTTTGNTYWPQVYGILNAAAADLGITLSAYEFDIQDRFAKAEEGVEILRAHSEVDGAIFSVAFGQTLPLLEATAERDIPVMIQGPLFEVELPALGYAPRQRFPNWIATFEQSEFEKGYHLGRILIQRAIDAELFGPDGTVLVGGVGGDPSWFGSERRAAGLIQAVEEEARATLTQIVPTQWTQQQGRRSATGLLRRYDGLSVIWCASDQLAIGAATAVRQRRLAVGEDVLIGGLDLSTRGLRGVVSAELTATVASTLFSYAEALIYLYDYIHGIDFAETVGTEIVFPVIDATEANAETILRRYEDPGAIDYVSLSKYRNEDRDRYRFPWNGAGSVDR